MPKPSITRELSHDGDQPHRKEHIRGLLGRKHRDEALTPLYLLKDPSSLGSPVNPKPNMIKAKYLGRERSNINTPPPA